MLFGCVFETELHIGGPAVLTVAPGVTFSTLSVGAPTAGFGPGFDGVALTFKFVGSGGTADSGALISLYRSFDGTVVDDSTFDQITVAAANINEGTWYQTAIYPTVPGESGAPACGYGLVMNFTKQGGDRSILFDVWRRRWRWKAGL